MNEMPPSTVLNISFYFFILSHVFFHVSGGDRVSRGYGFRFCCQIVADITNVDWFLLSLTEIT